MNFIIGIAAALGLSIGALFAPSAPVPVAEAGACKTVTSASARGNFYSSPSFKQYSLSLSWQHSGFGSQQYVVERSNDAGATWTVVQASTSKTYSETAMTAIGDDVVFRVSTAGCDTAGVVLEWEAPNQPASGVLYFNAPIPLS